MKRFHRVAEYIRTSLWVVPAIGVLFAVALGLATIELDQSTSADLGFSGDVDGARSILSTIAAAMITFTGLVFSITIVALQLASGQFSPRVMRTFLRDIHGKLALATFVATFSFALTVLRSVRTDAVPGLSVTIAIVLVFVSVAVFIHYINHTAHSIRATAIIESVAEESRACIARNYPEERDPPPPAPQYPGHPQVVVNPGKPGVVTGFDGERIVGIAETAGAFVRLRVGVGDFVPAGAPLLEIHGATAADCSVAGCVAFGQERTMHQDAAFGFRQLVDLAAKALSPGINDPTTAVQAIDQIHDLLRRLATVPIPAGRQSGSDGVVRLEYPSMGWDDYISLAIDEIRHYGAGSLQVQRRLRSALEDLLTIVAPSRRAALEEQIALLSAAAEREFDDQHDREAAGRGDAQGVGS